MTSKTQTTHLPKAGDDDEERSRSRWALEQVQRVRARAEEEMQRLQAQYELTLAKLEIQLYDLRISSVTRDAGDREKDLGAARLEQQLWEAKWRIPLPLSHHPRPEVAHS